MIRLAMLLVGAPAFRRRWWVLPVVGALWIAVGAFLIVDATDGELRFATDVLGLVLALEGALSLLALLLSPAEMRPALMWRSGVLLALGALILLPLAADEVADRVLFGAAFLVDGALRVGAAWVVRFSGWRSAVALGLLQLVAAFLVMGNWPIHHGYVVPMVLGFVLISSGWALCMLGTQLRNLAPGASITTLPMFFARGWYGPDGPPRPHADAHPDFDPPQPMTLYVWTAQGSADRGRGPPLVRRYIAAIDEQGVVSTGHSALEVLPDVYISHYPAVEIDHSPDDFAALLRAGPENDIQGRWIPDHATGVRDWVEPDQKVVFHHYDGAALRAFWNEYRRDSTYNLTSRSCSTATSLALETALEGVLGERRQMLRFAGLLLDPDLWLAAAVRRRAATMAWTPGLVLDYARLLRAIVARHRKSEPAELEAPVST